MVFLSSPVSTVSPAQQKREMGDDVVRQKRKRNPCALVRRPAARNAKDRGAELNENLAATSA